MKMTAQAEILQPHTHTHTVQLIAVESFDTHATQGVSSKICDLTARTSSDEENKKKAEPQFYDFSLCGFALSVMQASSH